MDFDTAKGFITAICLIAAGFMVKYSTKDELVRMRKRWYVFVIIGGINIVFGLYKYLHL